jgi:hypothetical protein
LAAAWAKGITGIAGSAEQLDELYGAYTGCLRALSEVEAARVELQLHQFARLRTREDKEARAAAQRGRARCHKSV